MRVLDLFSGIGGFSLAAESASFETVAFCEIEPYATKVLNRHWPDVPVFPDVKELASDALVDAEQHGLAASSLAGGAGERAETWFTGRDASAEHGQPTGASAGGDAFGSQLILSAGFP